MDGLLTFADGQVRLGEKTVPGILRDMCIRGSVRFDESERDGMSGKTRMPMGWEDCAISMTVELLTDGEGTCYDKLSALNGLFQGHDNDANPRVLTVAGAHITARGIEHVVFSGLSSSESNQDDSIAATLEFTEHQPPLIRAEQRAGSQTDAAEEPGLDSSVAEGSR